MTRFAFSLDFFLISLTCDQCLNSNNNSQNIGVISPYRRQADALTNSLRLRWLDFPTNSMGTV
ncbi:MAG: hypothetical protein AB4368_25510, partial [Xenococcaceae cyanobacterium]